MSRLNSGNRVSGVIPTYKQATPAKADYTIAPGPLRTTRSKLPDPMGLTPQGRPRLIDRGKIRITENKEVEVNNIGARCDRNDTAAAGAGAAVFVHRRQALILPADDTTAAGATPAVVVDGRQDGLLGLGWDGNIGGGESVHLCGENVDECEVVCVVVEGRGRSYLYRNMWLDWDMRAGEYRAASIVLEIKLSWMGYKPGCAEGLQFGSMEVIVRAAPLVLSVAQGPAWPEAPGLGPAWQGLGLLFSKPKPKPCRRASSPGLRPRPGLPRRDLPPVSRFLAADCLFGPRAVALNLSGTISASGNVAEKVLQQPFHRRKPDFEDVWVGGQARAYWARPGLQILKPKPWAGSSLL
ncbi:hypothetical protein B0H10DRAFT_2269242 [Mycena sp. CBHHK59/15]|nr:hypothetical protein B0H10DRAFT_2269242 [Mycena sp. CBHHK59/15]